MLRLVEADPPPTGRLYLDVGTGEAATMVAEVRRLREVLIERGLEEGPRFRYVEDEGAGHDESHWGRRFRDALPFLLERQESLT
jgi:enterochelin esterase-like enzyme